MAGKGDFGTFNTTGDRGQDEFLRRLADRINTLEKQLAAISPMTAKSQSVTPPSAPSAGVTQVGATAPLVASPSPIRGVGSISHADSGVAAGAYGDATHVLTETVDEWGHVTVLSAILPLLRMLTADPASPGTGEFWYRTDTHQFSVQEAGGVKRVTLT